MNTRIWRHVCVCVCVSCFLSAVFFARAFADNAPPAGFLSYRQQLPNPDRPYEMTGDPVNFGPVFTLYDLQFSPRNSTQLDIPSVTSAQNWEFDSSLE